MIPQITLIMMLGAVGASNPFNSNVISLTPRNWKEVENSPHAWFINICRVSWGYCQLLTPHWQELAGKLKGSVKVAYWDTEQGANPPAIVGQIQGTPTIKYIYPSKKNKKGQHKKKVVQDYQGARETKPMISYATSKMPNFVEKIDGEKALKKFLTKADEYGLPQILVFSKSAGTASMVKAVSTEFRRRILIGEVKGTKSNENILKKYNIKELPKIIALKENSSVVEFNKKPSYNSLNFFVGKHALTKPVMGKKVPPKKQKEL